MRNFLGYCFLLLAVSAFSQNAKYDIVLSCKSKSDIRIHGSKNDTIDFAVFNYSWPKKCDYKKIGLKIDENGKLVNNINLSAVGSYTLRATYINTNSDNRRQKISTEELSNKIVIKFEDFIFYELLDLILLFKNAESSYIIFEDEKKNDQYKIRKVTVAYLPQM